MPEVTLRDGGTLFYEEHGAGEPVVFLNGIMMGTRSWVDHVPRLAPHVRLVLVDFRDQGRSSTMSSAYDLGLHVADVVELLDALGLQRVHLMGLSYGGEVALLLARAHPQRLCSLILSNVPRRTGAHLAAVGRAWEDAAALEDGRAFFRLAIPFVYSAGFYEREREWLDSREELFGRVLTPEWFQGLIRLCRAAARYEVTPAELAEIEVPTLLIGADEDLLVPLRELEELRDLLPSSELLVLNRAGHGAFLERISEFTTAVLGFVTKHARR